MMTLRTALIGVLTLSLFSGAPAQADGVPTLTGFASLPAATFVPGSEPSGGLLGTAPINGVAVPFADQPVQGFSGIARNRDGSFDVLSDNGYGNIANSSDFLLRIQRIIPDFPAKTVDVVGGVTLTDPSGHVPFPLTRTDRVLTGADFDLESIVKTADGGYWIGDEFGPYLLHFDRAGRLLAPPVPLPGVFAPESAARAGVPANLGSSKGFEGMAASGQLLYPLLEGTVTCDEAATLRINEFNLRTGSYTGRRWTYRMESPANAIGDFIAIDRGRFLVIERDNFQGEAALFKRIYAIDLTGRKTLLVDLLNLADPRHLGGPGDVFRFPFTTIEDVVVLDDRTIGVLNDNNFPFSSGRTPGAPDNNEFITVRLPRKL
jgi:hypothetical protein